MSNPQVKCWRLLIEKFDYALKYIPEKDNKIADTMSRMHVLCNNESLMTNNMFYSDLLNSPRHPISLATYLDNFLGENTDTLNIDYLIAYDVISSYQKQDEHLQRNLHQNSAYNIARITDKRLEIVLRNNKIFIPTTLQKSILEWYYINLHHPRADRLFGILNQHFFGLI